MMSERSPHLVGASFLLIPLAWLRLPAVRIGPWIQLESAAANRLLAAPVLSRAEYLRFAGGAREYAVLARQPQTPHLRIMIPALSFAWLAGILALADRLLVGRGRPRESVRLTAVCSAAREPTMTTSRRARVTAV